MRIRRLVAALAALSFVAACAADENDEAAPQPAVTEPGGTPATEPAEPGSPAVPATEAPSPPGDANGSPATSASPTTTTTEARAATSPPPAPGGVGAYAAFYLRPAESASILVDVRSQSGAGPRSSTLQHLVSVLGQVSGKQVTVGQGELTGEGRSWTAADIRALADSVSPPQSRERAVLTLLYLRGELAERENVVGVAVRSDVAAVFADKVDEAAGLLGNPAAIEDAVTVHEVGHILGLVDLVLDTGREDPEHPGHSPNRDSVMYYAVESTLIGTIFEGGPPRNFDQADLDDLARIRND